jgi:raffinose/stachyose/melibiose transport system permease protein
MTTIVARRKRLPQPDRTTWLRYVVAVLAVFAYAAPLYIAVINAFKTNEQISVSPIALPSPFTLDNIIDVLTNPDSDMIGTLVRTIVVTATSVALIVLLGSMLGYYIGRNDRTFQRVLLIVLLLGLSIPSQVLLIPVSQILKSVGLLSTYPGLILYNVAFYVPFAVLIFSRFVKSIPHELDEAAAIDGAGPLRTYFTIIFPLMRPAAASVTIFVSIWIWNDFVNPLILLGPATGTTVMAGLYRTLGQYTSDFGGVFAYMFVATLPVVILFLFLQRAFVSGLVSGASKG